MLALRTVATFYPHVTGPAYQAYRISRGLAERGHRSPLVTTPVVPESEDPGYPPDMDPADGFPFEVVRHRVVASVDQYRVAPGALLELRRTDPDVVHAHGYHNALKDLLYIANAVRDVPFVVHTHGSLSKEADPTLDRRRRLQYRLYDRVWKRTATSADAVVVSSKEERERALEFGIDSDRVRVIGVGKDPEVYSPAWDEGRNGTEAGPEVAEDRPLRVLFVGRLDPRRNVETLIDAAAELTGTSDDRDRRPPLTVRIVGDEGNLAAGEESYVDSLRDRAAAKGVGDVVSFVGSRYGEDLIGEYRRADVYVNPSHYENFGQTVLEAAFCGLPVLSTPTGVAPELFAAGDVGHAFEGVDELVGLIGEYLDDPGAAAATGRRAREVAVREYGWDAIVEEYLALYRTLV